jgi:hypothetical protein
VATKEITLVNASSLLLHHLFLFSIDIGNALRTTRHLYNVLERRTQGNSLLLAILSSHDQHLPFASLLVFFLSRSNGMATALW